MGHLKLTNMRVLLPPQHATPRRSLACRGHPAAAGWLCGTSRVLLGAAAHTAAECTGGAAAAAQHVGAG
jgi:hypothetical protein